MKAVIFDMDGVIIDSEPMHLDVDIKTMAYFGFNITGKEFEKYVGMTSPEMWRFIRSEYNIEQSIEEIINNQLEKKINILRDLNIEPIDGIKELLFELKSQGIPIAIASSSAKKLIEEVLRKFDLRDYFQCVASGEEVEKGKPAPDVYIEAAKGLRIHPSDCIVIEDSRNGVRAAKSAGMKCIGYQNINSGNQDLSEADSIIHSITEINISELI